MRYDYLIVGAGLYGATFAHLAKQAGKRVLVVERRNHVSGNAYTEKMNGINVHKYGAHIFHTNDDEVWEFINQFAKFNHFVNSPIAKYHGEVYSLPFNMYTFNKMWDISTPEEAKAIIKSQTGNIKKPQNLEEQAIALVGKDIYEILIKGYTEKQWGRPCNELPASIIKRLPIRFTYDNNYFNAKHQGIPIGGYTKIVEKMLDGIEVRLCTDYFSEEKQLNALADKVIYTGPIDKYFGYQYGSLQYRSLNFETKCSLLDNLQGNAVVNYTDKEHPWTRIIEHKWFEFGKDENGEDIHGTVFSREYPVEWHIGVEPYYPIVDDANKALYAKYKALADSQDKVHFGGRLGEYKYYDMDRVIRSAIDYWGRVRSAK